MILEDVHPSRQLRFREEARQPTNFATRRVMPRKTTTRAVGPLRIHRSAGPLRSGGVAHRRVGRPRLGVDHLTVFAFPLAVVTDTRRALVLAGVSQVRILLRRFDLGGYGPPIPLAGLDDVERFFASVSWSDSMYDWKFIDEPTLVDDWPPSLIVKVRPAAAAHALYWFAECGRAQSGDQQSFCIEGDIEFEPATVEQADGTVVDLETFASDGRRWWEGLRGNDRRVSEAQKDRPRLRHGGGNQAGQSALNAACRAPGEACRCWRRVAV
jgi:hypothetical protein